MTKVKKWNVTPRQRCDVEMLLMQAFAPLTGFMNEADYIQVLAKNRLSDGSVWPMPVTLDTSAGFAASVGKGETVELVDADNSVLAELRILDKWRPDKRAEAESVFGALDKAHPGVQYLLEQAGEWYLGGEIRLVHRPAHYDFIHLRHTPQSLKQFFAESGWQRIVGFQTRNPMHRAHMELTMRACEAIDGHLLLHPVVGMTKPGDIDYYTRVRCYEKILRYYPTGKTTLSLLPLAMRMAGPREALWHALIRKNYGCTHFIVGRSHADPSTDSSGTPFYPPYAAQELLSDYEREIGIIMVPFQEMVYVRERAGYTPADEVKPDETVATVSGTELRAALKAGIAVPDWFSFPEIMEELQAAYPPRYKQGFTLFFTGLSGSGKTTIAHALMAKLRSLGKYNLTLLDGDIIRPILAPELGFSKADRDTNIHRIGYVASEVTKTGGIAICAAIAPYADAREKNRQLISDHGGYIEIHVATPFFICEARDVKGLYAKARAGMIPQFTGIDSPYEEPVNAEITLDTSQKSVQECIEKIVKYLKDIEYLS